MVMGKKNACLVACFICHSTAKQLAAWSYIPQNNLIQKNKIDSRRNVLAKICKWTLPVLTTTTGTFSTLPTIPVSDAYAKETTTQSTESDIATIQEATQALTNLLENWDRATIDCTYADVPRDLLEAKNKEKLLEKASEFALFDKSTSVVSCKKTNRIVRDYIGATGKGPLVGLEKKILRKGVVERVDPDLLDDYFSAAESFSQGISKATSLSYTAGMADFDAVNNFAKGEENASGDKTNLEQARNAIDDANKYLKTIVSLLTVEDSS